MAIEPLGDAFSAGLRIKVRYAWGPRDGMKRVRECVFGGVANSTRKCCFWTRGRESDDTTKSGWTIGGGDLP